MLLKPPNVHIAQAANARLANHPKCPANTPINPYPTMISFSHQLALPVERQTFMAGKYSAASHKPMAMDGGAKRPNVPPYFTRPIVPALSRPR